MKAIFSFTHLPFKHLFGHLTIGLLLIGSFAQAQEAFYIYRNDGDFNGFFYDEVVEMRYSKIGVDSVESDVFVTYEVELADTTYRIPLAAIDSIGFQQPEIKFNPRVKFLERDGYEPYLAHVKNNGCTFQDLPGNLPLQVGDILIGLPTDPRAEEMYVNTPGNLGPGSFSCMIDELSTGEYNGSIITYITGHPVDKISDVFEQYITVEQVGIDKDNHVRRRIAGCTQDGFPRKVQAASDEGELDLFDISFNLTREWNPSGIGKFDVAAAIGMKDKMRVAYNISWTKFYAKLTNELTTTVKPSIGMILNAGYEATSDDWVDIPHIYFPAVCPVFETNPIPMYFFRFDGTAEARLNLPQVQLGLATDFILDSGNSFPVSCSLHMIPDDEVELTDDMLDISGGVTFKGMLQTGIKFQMNIATANWFKKVLMTDLGLHLYVGPKITAQVVFKSDIFENLSPKVYETASTYETLRNSFIDFSFLSIDLEAKAKAAAFWKDPTEKKFFDTNLSLLCDTIRFAPLFDSIAVDYDSTTFEAKVRLFVRKEWIMGCSRIQLGRRYTHETDFELIDPIVEVGPKDADTVAEYTLENIRCNGYGYHFIPIVRGGELGNIRGGQIERYWSPGLYFEPTTDTRLVFGAKKDLKQSIDIATNISKGAIWGYYSQSAYSGWIETEKCKKDTIDDEKGLYRIVFEVSPNTSVFNRETCDLDSLHPYIYGSGIGNQDKQYLVDMIQDAPDLSNVNLYLTTSFKDESGQVRSYAYNGKVTVTTDGKDAVHVEGTIEDDGIASTQKTLTVSLDFKRTQNYNKGIRETEASGTFTYHSVSTLTSVKKEIQYEVSFGPDVKGNIQGANGPLQTGSFKQWENDVLTVDTQMSEEAGVNFKLTAQ